MHEMLTLDSCHLNAGTQLHILVAKDIQLTPYRNKSHRARRANQVPRRARPGGVLRQALRLAFMSLRGLVATGNYIREWTASHN